MAERAQWPRAHRRAGAPRIKSRGQGRSTRLWSPPHLAPLPADLALSFSLICCTQGSHLPSSRPENQVRKPELPGRSQPTGWTLGSRPDVKQGWLLLGFGTTSTYSCGLSEAFNPLHLPPFPSLPPPR